MSTGTGEAVPGRPRDVRIDSAVLDAAAELVVDVGYRKLTMAAIADRAGTTKTALYRRWSGKAELIHDLAFSRMARLPPSSGEVEADLRIMVAAARDLFASPVTRAALPGLISDMAAEPELSARVHAGFAEVFGALRDRLVTAVDRGEVHPDVDPDRLIEVVGGAAMLHALLLDDREFDTAWADQLSALVVHGVLR
ncbi:MULTISPECIES: TetR/AcrR family transcriptional regulator [Gordonia]|jgi:AcrR family transcriptional regulator|uniref:TetR family transcriptional regulator n=2 Tax=Gordonia terrae TaxID=2055 RepID=A0A2I1R9N5_9ACTN|nr:MULTISPECIES: TetR/AcrR family transcriptional regulator [Gordonia]VTR08365.1 TetR family transcriptional regulator [Clostridioides difficile]ANY25442.1 TetR family transcriptional regulator [Gordonia terrae]AWO86191.1 TetR family transcriptional regulator [Gordonia terrae]MCG7633507.1 TetR/AcrR family transcriptional regulator [Gordonia sp. McavH-238-E]PKZ65795.1 TetR family transcriptional regulator [Gordonia terrae]